MTPTSGQQLRLLFCFFSSFLFSVLSLFFSAQAAFCKKNSSTLFCCKVSSWLQWAAQEFQLLSDSVSGFIQNFRVSGPDLCNYSRHHFLSRFSIKSCLIVKVLLDILSFAQIRAPVFVGDVLWEHLQLLKQEAPYYLPRVSRKNIDT